MSTNSDSKGLIIEPLAICCEGERHKRREETGISPEASGLLPPPYLLIGGILEIKFVCGGGNKRKG